MTREGKIARAVEMYRTRPAFRLDDIAAEFDVDRRTISRWLRTVPDLERRRHGMGPAPTPVPHGTEAGYGRGCREECCRTAHARYWREWNARRRAQKARVS